MIFPFPVKHNGVNYEAGQEVPIGQEPVKENSYEELSANEIRKILREEYGVEKFPSNKKADLIEMMKEAEANKGKEADEPKDDESDEDEEGNEPDASEDDESKEGESEGEGNQEVTTPDGKSSFLDKILGK